MIRRSLENVYVKLKNLNKGDSECDQFNKQFKLFKCITDIRNEHWTTKDEHKCTSSHLVFPDMF